jgi:predicted transcriptional regulator
MNNKLRILKILAPIYNGDNNTLPLNNLEKLINLHSTDRLISKELKIVLEEMRKEDLITSPEEGWYYSITPKGLGYLKKHSEE